MNARRTLISVALGMLLVPALATADTTTPNSRNRGYVVDQNMNVLRSGAGVCIRSGEWTPALAASAAACRDCTPELCPVRAAATPTPPVAAAPPEPAPPPAAAAAPREPQRLSFAADTLFDFDKAELRPQGKSLLDALARDISTMNYDSITITGHADRIGDADYNQKLSERRANAVREYLLSRTAQGEGSVAGFTGGAAIDPGKVTARGVGEEQPVTKSDECPGERKTRQLIQCLQPDRRVEVEVQGTE